MSDHSQIQWTDATWNPITGCTKVSPGCAHCYIERTPAFRIHGRAFVRGATDLRLHDNRLEQPLHWRKPRRVFVNSLSDIFHADVPDAFIDRIFAVMALSQRHTFQILTKRPERLRAYFADPHALSFRWSVECEGLGWTLTDAAIRALWPLPNVWLGVSVENQHFADERIPLLLQTPAAIRFISAEPLLAPVDLSRRLRLCSRSDHMHTIEDGCWNKLDWVIVGGESGPVARPFEVTWARSIVRQCKVAGVACYVKQLGENVQDAAASRDDMCARETWPAAEVSRDGRWRPLLGASKAGDPAEWPADLRVREYPPIALDA
jgi:protein gp37